MNYIHAIGTNPPPGATMAVNIKEAGTCADLDHSYVDCTTKAFQGRFWSSGYPDKYVIIAVRYLPGGSFTLNVEQLPEGMSGLRLTSGPHSTAMTYFGKGWGYKVPSTCGGDGLDPGSFYWLQCPESPGGTLTADNCAYGQSFATLDSVFHLRSGVTGAELACTDDNPLCPANTTRSYLSTSIPPGAGLYALYFNAHDPPNLSDLASFPVVLDITVP
ncbi:Hypothetical protein A7982_02366 [Minicystis rosea]|nr:Hypothetical protein A7982_02366 [Minicystis rosea]